MSLYSQRYDERVLVIDDRFFVCLDVAETTWFNRFLNLQSAWRRRVGTFIAEF